MFGTSGLINQQKYCLPQTKAYIISPYLCYCTHYLCSNITFLVIIKTSSLVEISFSTQWKDCVGSVHSSFKSSGIQRCLMVATMFSLVHEWVGRMIQTLVIRNLDSYRVSSTPPLPTGKMLFLLLTTGSTWVTKTKMLIFL